MTHPLTDEMLRERFDGVYHSNDHFDADNMRAAADWQLEQVIQAWEQCLEEPLSFSSFRSRFDQKLKAMRPQQQQENN